MRDTNTLKLTSHVGRDLLASAAVFKSEAAVVWEYVVNSLQYVESGVTPKVQVLLRRAEKMIEVSDNGRGMDRDGLGGFFTMHGENFDRKVGRPGRGKFGTGKSAAFGIANGLTVDTRRGQNRNVVTLHRRDIDKSRGEDIPITWLVKGEPTDLPDGTTIRITDLLLDRVDAASIIEYIERHLQAFRALSPEVAVGNHICRYKEPAVAKTYKFHPAVKQANILGNVTLTINVAQAPLQEPELGVAVTSGIGNLVAIERCGVDRKEMGNYLFGDIDIPALESFETPIEPYDATRQLQLNPKHPVVKVLVGFVGARLEEVRKEQVRNLKDAQQSEQARRLAAEAEKIAEILNDDFRSIRRRLREIQSVVSTVGPLESQFGDGSAAGSDPTTWVRGSQEPGRTPRTGTGGVTGGASGRKNPNIASKSNRDDLGVDAVDPAGGSGSRSKPKGGFAVEYRKLGTEEDRSIYDQSTLKILINLDHAVVKAALGDGGVESVAFRRLSYEIAFSEYAVALGYHMAQDDPSMPADDVLFEVRDTLNRVATAAVALYR